MNLYHADLAPRCLRPQSIFAQGILCLLLFLSPAGNAAQLGDFAYEVTGSTITITKYAGGGGDVAIPATIDGLPVARIGEGAFYGCTALKSLTLPASVTLIGDNAFHQCFYLTSVTLPSGVRSIGDGAFSSCTRLTNIALPNSLIRIGDQAFAMCIKLTNINLPNSLRSIGDLAFRAGVLESVTIDTTIVGKTFSGSSHLKNVTIGGNVTDIGDSAFSRCSGLTNIVLPNSVTRIGDDAFSDCGGLTSLILPNSVTSIGNYTFYICAGLTNITLPNSVTCIGDSAFSHCARLKGITLPNSLIYIGDHAFSYCTALASLYFEGNAPVLDDDVFSSTTNAIVYHLAGTTGWGSTFGGLPTALWDPSYRPWAEACGLVAKYPNASGEQDDPDQDGLTNMQEMAAGTDPTQRTSTLAFEALARLGDLSEDDKTSVGPGQFPLYFQSIPGKTYEVQSAEALGGAWSVAATASATTTQKRVALDRPMSQRFYRVVIR